MQSPPECVVVIPCVNEERAILSLVESVRRQVSHVIVVDDGSTDATAALAAKAGAEVLRHDAMRGKGAALNTALRHAPGRGVPGALTLDGDGQHLVKDFTAYI